MIFSKRAVYLCQLEFVQHNAKLFQPLPGSSWCFPTAIVTDTVTTIHKDDSCKDVQNLRLSLPGRCDRDSRHPVVENHLPSAPLLESLACSNINDSFSVDNLQIAHVTRSNTMDPRDIPDACEYVVYRIVLTVAYIYTYLAL